MNRQKDYEVIIFPNDLFPILIHWNNRAPKAVDSHGANATTWHECFEILYVKEGEIQVLCDNQTFFCKTGDIFIVNPCEKHAVTFRSNPFGYYCLMIDPRLYEGEAIDFCGLKYMMPYAKSRMKVNNLIRGNLRAMQILDDLLLECREQKYAYEIMIKSHILRFLAELFRNELSTPIQPETCISDKANYALIAPVFSYIAENYNRKITLEELSELCCISSPHLCRVFKRLTGKTITEYLNEYRLSKVRLLLTTSDLSISEIAAESGYADERYMMRRFKATYGVSPGVFRNLNIEKHMNTSSHVDLN